MDSAIRADLEDLRTEGRGLLSKDGTEADRHYPTWAARLSAALSLAGEVAASQTVEFNSAIDVSERITENLTTLERVLKPTD